MVLELGDENDIARAEIHESPRIRHEVQTLGRVAGEDHLARVGSIDEAREPSARAPSNQSSLARRAGRRRDGRSRRSARRSRASRRAPERVSGVEAAESRNATERPFTSSSNTAKSARRRCASSFVSGTTATEPSYPWGSALPEIDLAVRRRTLGRAAHALRSQHGVREELLHELHAQALGGLGEEPELVVRRKLDPAGQSEGEL